MRRVVWLGCLGLWACAPSVIPGACYGDEVFTWYTDADGDGFGDPETATWDYCPTHATKIGVGGDCDDAAPDIHPDAQEVWYDDVDQDCDGASDHDQDGDGFDTLDAGGTDCDDVDGTRNPEAAEVWYDDVDQNCDGRDDHDQDGDGVRASSGGGDDCDDTDALTYPGAVEMPTGTDNDCNGFVDDVTLVRTTLQDFGSGAMDASSHPQAIGDGVLALGRHASELSTRVLTTPMPVPASSVGIVATHGAVYISGGATGFGSSGGQQTVARAPVLADGMLGDWEGLEPLPDELAGHTMMTDGRCLVVVGGGSPATGVLARTLTARIRDDGTLEPWTTQAEYPLGVSQPRGVHMRGYIYITGGSIDGIATSAVHRARLDADCSIDGWQSQTSLPLAISYHNALADGGHIYVLGGRSTGVWRATPSEDGVIGTWTPMASLPNTCWGSAATIVGGHILVVGGDVGSVMSDTIYRAELLEDGAVAPWELMDEALPQPRRFQTATTWADRAYVTGGWTAVDQVSVDRTDEVSVRTLGGASTRTRTKTLHQARFDMTSERPAVELRWELGGASTAVTYAWVRWGRTAGNMSPWTEVGSISPVPLTETARYLDVVFELEEPTGTGAWLESVEISHR